MYDTMSQAPFKWREGELSRDAILQEKAREVDIWITIWRRGGNEPPWYLGEKSSGKREQQGRKWDLEAGLRAGFEVRDVKGRRWGGLWRPDRCYQESCANTSNTLLIFFNKVCECSLQNNNLKEVYRTKTNSDPVPHSQIPILVDPTCILS